MKKFSFEQSLVLENDKSRLEPLTMEHFEHLLPICLTHPNLLAYSPSPFGDEAQLRAYFKLALTQAHRYPFAIYDKVQNCYAGSTSFGNISNQNQRLEIGWTWLDPKCQRTGLNRNNKFLMLQYAFEVLNFERVELKTDNRNEQSKTAMLKIGAIYEGTLRSHTLMRDGHRRDTAYFGILKSDWEGVKAKLHGLLER